MSINLLVDVPEEFDIVEQGSQDEDSHWEKQNQSRGDGSLKKKIANNIELRSSRSNFIHKTLSPLGPG